MTTKSIRWRLLAWLALMLGVLLAGLGVTAYQLVRHDRLQRVDEILQRRISALAADVRGPKPTGGRPGGHMDQPPGPPPQEFTGEKPMMPPGEPQGLPPSTPPSPPPEGGFPERMMRWPGAMPDRGRITPTAETLAMFDENSPEAPYFVFWSRMGTETKSKLAPAETIRPLAREADSRIHVRMIEGRREAYFFTERGDCVLTGIVAAKVLRELRLLAWWLAGAGLAVLATGVGGGWLLVSAALRPVEKIGATAGRIAAGALSERIDVADTESELGRLALALNATFARLEAAFAEQRQFTADASHEMRTPLAVIISESQATLARERPAAEYRETVEICLEAAQQMRRVADSLLQLARFDAGQEALRREPVDLEEIARHTVELMGPLARQRQIQLDFETEPTPCAGDGDRLEQVARNLVDNAIFYNVDGGRVMVRTWGEAGTVQLSVTDSGRGIAPEDLPYIFQRFYRADKSRSRSAGRSGLGLAICRAIVEAHGGAITVASEPGRGSTFTVSLPRRAAG